MSPAVRFDRSEWASFAEPRRRSRLRRPTPTPRSARTRSTAASASRRTSSATRASRGQLVPKLCVLALKLVVPPDQRIDPTCCIEQHLGQRRPWRGVGRGGSVRLCGSTPSCRHVVLLWSCAGSCRSLRKWEPGPVQASADVGLASAAHAVRCEYEPDAVWCLPPQPAVGARLDPPAMRDRVLDQASELIGHAAPRTPRGLRPEVFATVGERHGRQPHTVGPGAALESILRRPSAVVTQHVNRGRIGLHRTRSSRRCQVPVSRLSHRSAYLPPQWRQAVLAVGSHIHTHTSFARLAGEFSRHSGNISYRWRCR